MFCYITIVNILFPSWVIQYSHCKYSIPIVCSVIFPLQIFYSHHGLYNIPIVNIVFPLCVLLYSHCKYCIPSWVIQYSHCKYCIPIVCSVIFPLQIFYSHHGLYNIPIVNIVFPLCVLLYSHCKYSIPIMGYTIFPL